MKDEKAEVLLVNANGLILQGIRRVMEKMPCIEAQYTATSVREATNMILVRTFDLYVIDIEFSDGSGFDLIDLIRRNDRNARIIVNTIHEEIWLMNRLICCDVLAVVLKSSDITDIEKAVVFALRGEPYYCLRFEKLRRRLRSRLCLDNLKKDVPTTRELEVLNAISQGYNTAQIAEKLSISENTVETFRKKLMQKFDAKNSIDMIMKAINQGWIIP